MNDTHWNPLQSSRKNVKRPRRELRPRRQLRLRMLPPTKRRRRIVVVIDL